MRLAEGKDPEDLTPKEREAVTGAVQAAIASGELDENRLMRWQKLAREDRRNSETIAESRGRDKAFAKIVKEAVTEGRRKRGL